MRGLGRFVLLFLVPGLLSACVAREPDRPPVRLTFLQFNDHHILEPVDRERQKGGMLATAKPAVFPPDGPCLAETLIEAIERAAAMAPATEGADPDEPLRWHGA